MRLAVDAYDKTVGGKQTLPLFVVPSAVLELTIEPMGEAEHGIGKTDELLAQWTLGLPGVDVSVFVDGSGKVVFADVPAQHGAYVREGYEAMLRPSAVAPLLSAPTFEVSVETNVMVAMRDGVALATDLYKAVGDGAFPVILIRTPYGKQMSELEGRYYARRGYLVAVQDCRGRFASEGVWEPFMNEPADGYDTIEWLGVQPWSTGKVGMIGASYVGWVQWWAARDRPPHLATIIPNVAPPDPFYNIPYEYGTFFLLGAIWWADILEAEATVDVSGEAMRKIGDKKYALLLQHLPVIDLDELLLGKQNKYWRDWIAHPNNDEYWEPANFLERLGALDIPVFNQSGWFDGDGIGSKLNTRAMAGHKLQKLVLGAWGHTDRAGRMIGERDFGPDAIIDLQRDYLRWFDHFLKGVDNGIDREPLVSIFVMGSNLWLHGDTYPLPQTQPTKLYLSSGGHANTSNGDGALVFDAPANGAPSDVYVYDPGDPTPSPELYIGAEDLEETDTVREFAVEEEKERHRAYYASVDAAREDILVYDTPALETALTFAGPVEAVLYASSSAKDTDWFMRLSEVDAKGAIFPLVEGKIRARFRESLKTQTMLEPGTVYEYHLDLWQTGITIPVGNTLRVEVASASFPSFSRNLNTGGHNETETEFMSATQTIWHDAKYPSHVLLPVIELPNEP